MSTADSLSVMHGLFMFLLLAGGTTAMVGVVGTLVRSLVRS